MTEIATEIDAYPDADPMGTAVAVRTFHAGTGLVSIEPVYEETAARRSENRLTSLVRRVIEVSISLIGLALLGLAMPFIWLAVRLDSPGPVIFRQQRAGLHGRPFTLYKLRTMVHDAEDLRDLVIPLNCMNGVTFKAPGDPRRTRVGRCLRRFSLDELPQMVNVLLGQMALVGPRPLPLDQAERLQPHERSRLDVRPGITGLWQVCGRNLLEHDQMMKLDLEYIENRRLWVDLGIITRTIPAMLRGRGAF